MEEILSMTFKQAFEYGILGFFAIIGWSLAGWFLWRDHSKKNEVSAEIQEKNKELKEKDAIIEGKDKEIKELTTKLTDTVADLSDKRLDDVKEMISDYNELATNTVTTLDKLTTALEIVRHTR